MRRDDIPLFGLGLAVGIAYWPGLLSAAFVPRWAVVAVGLPLVSTIDPRRLVPSVSFVLIWSLAIAALSLSVTPQFYGGVGELIFLLILSAAFVAGSGLENIDPAFSGLALGLAPSTILAIAQFYGWHPIPQGSTGPAGFFYNSEILGETAAILIAWAILTRRWWALAISAPALAVADSRIGIAAVAICLCVAGFRYRPKYAVLGLIAVAAMGMASLVVLGAGKFGSAGMRVVLWGATIEAMTPFGNGLGWFAAAHPLEGFAHSDVLQWIAEVGIGGAALLWIPIRGFLSDASTVYKALFVGVCLEALVSFPFHLPATGFVGALLAGHLASRGIRLRSGESLGRGRDGARFGWGTAINLSFAGHGR